MSVFSAFGLNTERYEYFSIFRQNAAKYGPEKLRIQTLFAQCYLIIKFLSQGILNEKCPNTEKKKRKYGPEKTPYLDTFGAVVNGCLVCKLVNTKLDFDCDENLDY